MIDLSTVVLPAEISDPLVGCVLAPSERFTGLLRLLHAPAGMDELLVHPGVIWIEKGKNNPEPASWYVPVSLAEMGQHPGRLSQIEDPGPLLAPSGLMLHPHQRKAVAFLRAVTRMREGAILAGAPGVGKTNTVLQALHMDGYLGKPLLVCGPLSARAAWCGPTSDPAVHYRMSIQPLEGTKPDPSLLERHTAFFINYEILEAWQGFIFGWLKPCAVVFDEAHYVCHANTRRAKAAIALSRCATIDKRYLLTGTPIPNKRMDLFAQLQVAQPRQWGFSSTQFGVRYCGLAQSSFQESSVITYNEQEVPEQYLLELRARLAGTLLHYEKNEATEGLPELRRRVVYVELDDATRDEYQRARRDVTTFLRQEGELNSGPLSITIGGVELRLSQADQVPAAIELRMISTLIGILSEAKARSAVGELAQMADTHSHLVSFSWRIAGAQVVSTGVPPELLFGPVDGSMKQEERQALAQEFAKSEAGVYVATMGAAGVAINDLKCASGGLFTDLHWLPSTLIQAESRIHRSGNDHPSVEIVYLAVKDTIDEFLLDKLQEKVDAAASVMPDDQQGYNLIGDLTPGNTTADGTPNIEAILALLRQVED